MMRALVRLLICCGLAFGAPVAGGTEPASPAARAPRILFIDTQQRGSPWADQIARGFTTGIGDKHKIEAYFEQLDAVRLGMKFAPELAQLMRRKYEHMPPDILVAIGAPALDFALRQRDAVAPGRPILYTSITLPGDLPSRLDHVAGLIEMPDIEGTIRLARSMNPQVRRLVVVGQLVGNQVHDSMLHTLDGLRSLFDDIVVVRETDVGSVTAQLARLPKDSAVLIIGWIRDANGVNLSAAEVERHIAAAAPVPVYSLWDVTLGHGAVGGKILSSERQGEALGRLAARLLAGEPLSSLPKIAPSPTHYFFDHRALQRFALEDRALPPGSTVLNVPPSLYETHPGAVVGAAAMIVVLIIGVVTLTIVIRVRQQASAKVSASEARYRLLFEESPNPMFVFDEGSLRITAVNAAFCDVYGYSLAESVGQSVRALVAPDQRDALDARLARIAEPEMAKTAGRWRHVRRDGSELEVEVWSRRISFDQNPSRLAITNDITARVVAESDLQRLNAELELRVDKRTRELEQAMAQLLHSEKLASLGSLVAGVAHELNTPLGNATTIVTTIAAQFDEMHAALDANNIKKSMLVGFIANCSEACAVLERNVQRAADLVSSFKQVAVDQSSMRRREFRLAELVSETLLATAPSYKRLPVTVDDHVDGEIRMNSYPGAIEQVLTNLLMNAVIHALDGRPSLTITIKATLTEADQVRLCFTDDGVGMNEDVSRHAFDPFFTTRLGQGGSGLGLYLVHNLVTGPLGGTLHLTSKSGIGTLVEILLPRSAPTMAVGTPSGRQS